jgi:diaminopimelate epimerase
VKIYFVKMQALGNDFVIIDAIAQGFLEDMDSSLIQNISDRHTGVGCDQVLIVKESKIADVAISIFNPDASPAMACGNGTRCVAWLYMQEMQNDEISIQVGARVLHAWKAGEHNISVDMLQPTFDASFTSKLQEKIPATFVSFGNPHVVVEGAYSEHDSVLRCVSEIFPDGANVEWLTVIDEHCISISIHERGAGLTKACGTGACASAVVAISKGCCKSPVTVLMQGGNVRVDFSETAVLTGTCSFVFEGKIDYSPACTSGSLE